MINKIIAVDFDGTIVEDKYPGIGKPKLFAFETLKQLQNEGYRLTLWTYRSGKMLDEAVEFCQKNGIEFYGINNSFVGEEFNEEKQSRKINADIFIDDRNLGGFPGWGEVYQIITKKIEFSLHENGKETVRKKKRGFFGL
ncbi:BT0820 family HAD-type phosphatase [Faecalibacter rhinopitheci]|uniref:Hydrolase n=1 Tax=Faecalibacter rhinopitheci TaxID=2779678 RepID=A0A8J7FP70_9FLAO|nr:hydrolase [Faecalibacter rhinopitheci]MBF0596769.1 hydrolase [Faecalibacter rhinopitheci]MBQ0147726.1 hydrolase [Candidatus Onthonaster equi]